MQSDTTSCGCCIHRASPLLPERSKRKVMLWGSTRFSQRPGGEGAYYVETAGVEEAFFFFLFSFFSFYNGKEFSLCTVERAGREVSKGKIS